jgi:hypothetical protein
MEVLHHPDVEKKGLKEYLLEGVMIFVAVTLGFFAESLREHFNDRHKEKQYIASFVTDLQIDTANIDRDIEYNISLVYKLDTFERLMLAIPSNQPNIVAAYKQLTSTLAGEDVDFSDLTYSQLKSAGDMRLIHGNLVPIAILDYENGIKNCLSQGTAYEEQMKVLLHDSKTIFRPVYMFNNMQKYIMLSDSDESVNPRINNMLDSLAAHESFQFVTTDPDVFNRYCSELGFYEGIITGYIKMIQGQRRKAVALLKLFQSIYDVRKEPR